MAKIITDSQIIRTSYLLALVLLVFSHNTFAQKNEKKLISLISKYNLDPKMVFTWNNDSLGCIGKSNYAFKLDTMQVLNGIKQEDFLDLFGNPDRKTDEGLYQYNVFSSCNNRNVHEVSYVEIVFTFKNNKLIDVTSSIVD